MREENHEHEHSHEHTHGYSHEHTHGYSHEHTHEHDHSHEHTHEHDHSHEHDHDHAHGAEGAAKITAILEYTLTHNEQHTEELGDLAHKLRHAGFSGAAAALDAAAEDFRGGNEKLRSALQLLKEVK